MLGGDLVRCASGAMKVSGAPEPRAPFSIKATGTPRRRCKRPTSVEVSATPVRSMPPEIVAEASRLLASGPEILDKWLNDSVVKQALWHQGLSASELLSAADVVARLFVCEERSNGETAADIEKSSDEPSSHHSVLRRLLSDAEVEASRGLAAVVEARYARQLWAQVVWEVRLIDCSQTDDNQQEEPGAAKASLVSAHSALPAWPSSSSSHFGGDTAPSRVTQLQKASAAAGLDTLPLRKPHCPRPASACEAHRLERHHRALQIKQSDAAERARALEEHERLAENAQEIRTRAICNVREKFAQKNREIMDKHQAFLEAAQRRDLIIRRADAEARRKAECRSEELRQLRINAVIASNAAAQMRLAILESNRQRLERQRHDAIAIAAQRRAGGSGMRAVSALARAEVEQKIGHDLELDEHSRSSASTVVPSPSSNCASTFTSQAPSQANSRPHSALASRPCSARSRPNSAGSGGRLIRAGGGGRPPSASSRGTRLLPWPPLGAPQDVTTSLAPILASFPLPPPPIECGVYLTDDGAILHRRSSASLKTAAQSEEVPVVVDRWDEMIHTEQALGARDVQTRRSQVTLEREQFERIPPGSDEVWSHYRGAKQQQTDGTVIPESGSECTHVASGHNHVVSTAVKAKRAANATEMKEACRECEQPVAPDMEACQTWLCRVPESRGRDSRRAPHQYISAGAIGFEVLLAWASGVECGSASPDRSTPRRQAQVSLSASMPKRVPPRTPRKGGGGGGRY